MNICKIENCNNIHLAKGYCGKHYQQIKRVGHILSETYRDGNKIIVDGDIAKVILKDKDCEPIAEAIVDAQDINLISQHIWHYSNGYAATNISYGKQKRMHQILNPAWDYTDHRDTISLNNRRYNLRQATHTENMRNVNIDCRNQTGYKGVRFRKGRKGKLIQTGNRYQGRITVDKKEIHLGYFAEPKDAARAYDKAALKNFGEFARINFPKNESQKCRI